MSCVQRPLIHFLLIHFSAMLKTTLISRFIGTAWGPSSADRTQVGPLLAPRTLLPGMIRVPLRWHTSWECIGWWSVDNMYINIIIREANFPQLWSHFLHQNPAFLVICISVLRKPDDNLDNTQMERMQFNACMWYRRVRLCGAVCTELYI